MSDKVCVIVDWKKAGAFIGVEFVMQISRYSLCPFLYDKVNEQTTMKPPSEYGLVCWVGEHVVEVKLCLNAAQMAEGAEMHKAATRLAKYAAAHTPTNGKPFRPSRYAHPLKPDTYLWSVTEVNKYALAKEGLLNWYHKKGVEGTIALIRDYLPPSFPLTDLTLEYALQQLEAHKLRPVDLRDKAGDQGRTWHKLAMFYLQGKPVDLTDAPQAHKDFAAKFAMWCSKVKLEPLAVEQMVYEEEPGIAGTLDCLAMVDKAWVEQEWERLHQANENVS